MAANDFTENRSRIQNVFLNSGFLKPLSKNDIPYTIHEIKNADLGNTLQTAIFDNIPISSNAQNSFVLDLEIKDRIFSLPEKHKTVEKAFLIFTCESLYVVMVEMKTSLQAYKSGLDDIEKKIKDSMSRLSIFLTHYILDNYGGYPIKFFNLILYNTENITQAAQEDKLLQKENKLVQIFFEGKGKFFNEDLLSRSFVELIFVQNQVFNSATITVDLNEIFIDDHEYDNAIYSDITLP